MKIKYLTIIPFNLPWNWSTDYTNQTARILGQKGTVICYMWADFLSVKEYLVRRKLPKPIVKADKNVYLFYPILFIPFRRFKSVVRLNENLNLFLVKLLAVCFQLTQNYNRKIFWLFDPQTEYLADRFNKSWLKLYDCVDYFAGASQNKTIKTKVLKMEKRLIKKADYVFANSGVLFRHLKNLGAEPILVPQGFRVDSFLKKIKSPNLHKQGRPLVGYVGAVNGRLNYRLLYGLASKHPEWDFALWGPLLEENTFTPEQKAYLNRLEKLDNLIRGKSEKAQIPGIIKQFEIGIIPYKSDSEFNKYCYPMKLFEYFYMQKPVISSGIEELKRFPDLVRIAESPKEWELFISEFIKNPLSPGLKNKARDLSLKNSWENKVGLILKSLK